MKYKVDFDTHDATREISRQVSSGELSLEELGRIDAWKKLIEKSGVDALSDEVGWDDCEETSGRYVGYRSSSVGDSGKRIIYEVIKQQGKEEIVIVAVVRVQYYG